MFNMRFLKSVLLIALAHFAAAGVVPRSATTDAASTAVDTVSTEEPAATTTETVAADTTAVEATPVETVTETPTETGTETATEEVVACKSIAELALADAEGRFTTLVELVAAAGLVDRLNNTDGSFGNVTVFAPINDAFAGVNASALTLADIFSTISLHVVPGAVLSSSLTDGQKVEPFVLGEQLTIGVGLDGTVTVNNATVIIADIEACNGVVHVIDQIITTAPEATATATGTETATATETATETETPAETETETPAETETETPAETETETPTETETESASDEETAAAETTTSA